MKYKNILMIILIIMFFTIKVNAGTPNYNAGGASINIQSGSPNPGNSQYNSCADGYDYYTLNNNNGDNKFLGIRITFYNEAGERLHGSKTIDVWAWQGSVDNLTDAVGSPSGEGENSLGFTLYTVGIPDNRRITNHGRFSSKGKVNTRLDYGKNHNLEYVNSQDPYTYYYDNVAAGFRSDNCSGLNPILYGYQDSSKQCMRDYFFQFENNKYVVMERYMQLAGISEEDARTDIENGNYFMLMEPMIRVGNQCWQQHGYQKAGRYTGIEIYKLFQSGVFNEANTDSYVRATLTYLSLSSSATIVNQQYSAGDVSSCQVTNSNIINNNIGCGMGIIWGSELANPSKKCYVLKHEDYDDYRGYQVASTKPEDPNDGSKWVEAPSISVANCKSKEYCYRKTSATGGSESDYKWLQEGQLKREWTRIPNMTRATCELEIPNFCTSYNSTIPELEDGATRTCSKKPVKLNFGTDTACTNDSNAIYTVSCKDEIIINYSPVNFLTVGNGDDPKLAKVKPGQGFSISINIARTKNCTGKLKKDDDGKYIYKVLISNYEKLLTRAIESCKTANKCKIVDGKIEYLGNYSGYKNYKKEIKFYTNIHRDVEGFLKTYVSKYVDIKKYINRETTDLSNEKEYSYTADIDYDYKVNGATKKYSNYTQYNKFEETSSTIDVDNNNTYFNSEINLQILNENGTGYVNYTVVPKYSYTIIEDDTLSPNETNFDRTGRELTRGTRASEESSNGGRKFFTDPKIDIGHYDLKINLNINSIQNPSATPLSTVKNEICDLEIVNNLEYIYRIIDVKNPFVNNERDKGLNWSNSEFDFTQAIDNNTWTKPYLYKFTLTKDDLKAIDASNHSVRNSSEKYLGTCSKAVALQDEAIKNVCSIINGN